MHADTPFALLLLLVAIIAAAPIHAARVDIECEDFAEGSVGLAVAEAGERVLSGDAGLTYDAKSPAHVSYSFEAPEGGEYALWVREIGWARNGLSTARWRVDEGEWQTVKQSWGLPQSDQLGLAIWNDWGRVELSAGEHTLRIETAEPVYVRPRSTRQGAWVTDRAMQPGTDYRLSMDRIILTTGPFLGMAEHARLLKERGLYPPEEPAGPEDWFTLSWGVDDFSDSVLDLVHPTPKPIGETLQREGDRFAYADGRPFRAWGQSAPSAPPKDEAEYYARRARRLGLTVVRRHSLDGDLCDPHAGKNYVIDERRLDRCEYFIHCLKEQGIYVNLDVLYNWQTPMVGEADGLPKGVRIATRERMPFFFDPHLQELNREFIRKLLTHRNPYTGLRNGEDPAVAFMSVVNENNMFFWALNNMDEHFQRMLTEQFNEWLLKRYGDREELAEEWGGSLKASEDPAEGTVSRLDIGELVGARNQLRLHARVADQVRFYYEVQTDFFTSVRDFVREDLGFDHILFNGSGWQAPGWLESVDMAANIDGMDLLDLHGYGLVMAGALAPAGAEPKVKRARSLVEQFASKTADGVPLTVTEWNNGNRINGPLMMACYGALQGWDGLYQYRMDSFDGARPAHRAANPAVYQQYPLACLAFARGYITEGDVVWREEMPRDKLFDCTRGVPAPGVRPIVGQCATAFAEADPVHVNLQDYVRENGQVVNSVNGELTWRAAPGALLIKAPKLQGLVGQSDGSPVNLGAVALKLQEDFVSVGAAALDDRPLAESRRMLLCAVGRTRGAEAPGLSDRTAPLQMKPVVGDVTFARPVAAVYALDLSGARKAEVEIRSGRTFRLDNTHRTVWFEIRR